MVQPTPRLRRGDRVVEGARLLSVCRGKTLPRVRIPPSPLPIGPRLACRSYVQSDVRRADHEENAHYARTRRVPARRAGVLTGCRGVRISASRDVLRVGLPGPGGAYRADRPVPVRRVPPLRRASPESREATSDDRASRVPWVQPPARVPPLVSVAVRCTGDIRR